VNETEDSSGCWPVLILMAMLIMSFGLGVLMTVVSYEVW